MTDSRSDSAHSLTRSFYTIRGKNTLKGKVSSMTVYCAVKMYGRNTSRTHPFSSLNMDMGDLLHTPAALPPGKCCVEGWSPETVWISSCLRT